MNAGYTESELQYMRKKAMDDAFEMRRRATPSRTRKRPADYGRKFFEGVGQSESSADKEPPPEPCFCCSGDSSAPTNKENERADGKSGIIGLQQGNDTVFILSIIMLLMSEKADFMLIFALMYILM